MMRLNSEYALDYSHPIKKSINEKKIKLFLTSPRFFNLKFYKSLDYFTQN